MNNRAMIKVLVMAMLLGRAGSIAAAEQAGKQAAMRTKTESPLVTTKGVVAALRLSAGVPALDIDAGNGNVVTLAVDPKVIVSLPDGSSAEPEDLAVGQAVEADHRLESGGYVAKAIRVTSAAPNSLQTTGVPAALPTPPAVSEDQEDIIFAPPVATEEDEPLDAAAESDEWLDESMDAPSLEAPPLDDSDYYPQPADR